MKKNLILGTANLNSEYGNLKNTLSIKDFNKCQNILIKNNLRYIETSFNYNNLNKLMKKIIFPNLSLIIKSNLSNIEIEKIKKTKKDLIHCVMIHNPDLLLKKKGYELYKKLENLKKKKFCKCIGVSFYNFSQIYPLIEKFNFDIIQIPLNIFDQRILSPKFINLIKRKNIKIQARSIFLQGLLVNKKHKFSKLKIFKKFYEFSKNSKKGEIFHCINFVKSIKFIDYVVLGANSPLQLNEIIKNFKLKFLKFDYSKFNCSNKKVINPYLW